MGQDGALKSIANLGRYFFRLDLVALGFLGEVIEKMGKLSLVFLVVLVGVHLVVGGRALSARESRQRKRESAIQNGVITPDGIGQYFLNGRSDLQPALPLPGLSPPRGVGVLVKGDKALLSGDLTDIFKEYRDYLKENKNLDFALHSHQFHDGGGARVVRWLAAFLAARYFGIEVAHQGFEVGAGISSIINEGKYCHKTGETVDRVGEFRCYDDLWDELVGAHHFSLNITDARSTCTLEDRSKDPGSGKPQRKTPSSSPNITKTLLAKQGCEGGLKIGGSASITLTLGTHSEYLKSMKKTLLEWQTYLRTFPRPGFPEEPKCMFSPDAVNVAIHLRRGDKRKARNYPVGKQNRNFLNVMHGISQVLAPDRYAKLVMAKDKDKDRANLGAYHSVFREMGDASVPSFEDKKVAFHIFTESDGCPTPFSMQDYLNRMSEFVNNEYVVEDSGKTSSFLSGFFSSFGDQVSRIPESFKSYASDLPRAGDSGRGITSARSFLLFEELSMWDLEPQTCGYSYPTECVSEYLCYGMYKSRCKPHYHCNSFTQGVWKVKAGRGDGYLPHDIYIHINGQPENDIYCMSQADIIWSPCSTFSQMSLMMSPLGKAFKIYNYDCKLPVEKQQNILAFAEELEHWVATKNERVPTLRDPAEFQPALRRWAAEWSADPNRTLKKRKAFGGYESTPAPYDAQAHIQSTKIFWGNPKKSKRE